MTTSTAGDIRLGDYSLVGKDTQLAIAKGLDDARWYASPIPRPLNGSLHAPDKALA